MGNYSEDLFKPNINGKVQQLSSENLVYFCISGPFTPGLFYKAPIKGTLKFKKDGTTIEQELFGNSIPEVVNLMYEFLNTK